MTPDVGYLRIATEEAFAPPELVRLWRSMLAEGTCDDPGFISLQGFYMRSKAERRPRSWLACRTWESGGSRTWTPRIITAGVFDRFPRLRIVVGHLGEALPFWLYRLDFMHAATVKAGRYESMKPIGRKPSEYLRSNVWVTTSGMPWAPAIMFCREVLGPDRVMYAMDYPYQYVPEEVAISDQLPLDAAAKKAFFQGIAEQVFGLSVNRSSPQPTGGVA